MATTREGRRIEGPHDQTWRDALLIAESKLPRAFRHPERNGKLYDWWAKREIAPGQFFEYVRGLLEAKGFLTPEGLERLRGAAQAAGRAYMKEAARACSFVRDLVSTMKANKLHGAAFVSHVRGMLHKAGTLATPAQIARYRRGEG